VIKINSFRAKLILTMSAYTVFISILNAFLFYEGLYISENAFFDGIVDHQYELTIREDLPAPLPQRINNTKLYLLSDPELPLYIKDKTIGSYQVDDTEIHYRIAQHPSGVSFVIILDDIPLILDKYEKGLEFIIIALVILSIIIGVLMVRYLIIKLTKRFTVLFESVVEAKNTHKAIKGRSASEKRLNAKNDDELEELMDVFAEYSQQLVSHVEREKYFTQHASHELRTPISIIKNSYHVLNRTNLTNEQSLSVIRIGKAAEKAKNLTNCFLMLARHHSEGLEDTNLEFLLLTAIGEYKLQIEASEIQLSYQTSACIKESHYSMVEVLLSNLLSNSIKHGINTLDIILSDNSLSFSNGSNGMPKERGFGLEICKRICKYHSWSLKTYISINSYTVTIHF